MSAMPSSGQIPVTSGNGSIHIEYEYSKESSTMISSLSPSRMAASVAQPDPDSTPESGRPLSPPDQINIFASGWDDEGEDDDEEDYVDMAPIAQVSRVQGQTTGSPRASKSTSHTRTEAENLVTTRSNDSGYYDDPSPDPGHIRMQTVQNHLSPRRKDAPSVVILPASPHGSIASQGSARSMTPSPTQSADSENTDSSEYSSGSTQSSPQGSEIRGESTNMNQESEEEDDYASLNDYPRPRSPAVTDFRKLKENSDFQRQGRDSPTPPLPPHQRKTSTAGQAARKYLQMQGSNSRSSSYDRESPKAPLKRSSSRAGARGVQSRISKSRQQVPSPTKSQSFCDGDTTSSPIDGVKMRQSPEDSNRAVTDPKITEAKRKSRTLDRDLSGAMLNSELTHHLSLEDLDDDIETDRDLLMLEEGKRRSRDGASVMRMISERRKSRSLDAKYLEYLQGVAKHASSAPSSPAREGSVDISERRDSKNKSKKKKHQQQEEEEDDDEAFRKYAAAMSAKTRTSGNGSSIETKSSKSSLSRDDESHGLQNLSDFAKTHSREKTKVDKISKKRLHTVSLAQKLSFRKSKSLGKVKGDNKMQISFAESAEAFHLQISKQMDVSSKSESKSQVKSNSLKREKRKSWKAKRHGLSLRPHSKERLNSDSSGAAIVPDRNSASQPPTPTRDLMLSDEDDRKKQEKKKSKSPPLIKQSLVVNASESPSLRPRKVSDGDKPIGERSRATSFERSTPIHSPKIMSPATGRSMTLGRGMTAFSDASEMHRYNSSGHLGSHAMLRSVSSLNSENSGSNSDISMPFEDEFEDRRERKSGTLSRLLGRKMKERRYDHNEMDLQDVFQSGSLGRRKNKRGKSATLGSPAMTLRMRHANSREALLEELVTDKYEQFFDRREFVHGFRVVFDDEELASDLGAEFELAKKMDAGGARVNKYATITGARTSSHGNYENLQKRTSDSAIEVNEIDGGTSTASSRRNNSMPVVLGSPALRSRSKHKRTQGSSGHLPFSEVLTENEIVGHTSPHMSPLRTRKQQTIEPLHEEPSEKILAAAKVLYRRIAGTYPDLIQSHKADEEKDQYGPYRTHENTIDEEGFVTSYPNCVFGQELVTWLVGQFKAVTSGQESAEKPVSTMAPWKKDNVCGMFQALLEEGALSHVRREHHFQDTFLLYQFHESVTRNDDATRPVSMDSTMSSSTVNSDINSMTSAETNESESQPDDVGRKSSRASSAPSTNTTNSEHVAPTVEDQELRDTLSYLQNVAPDAMFRMALRKLPEDRSAEELMMIYEEILRIKALAHLSDSVKRELAGVLKFEFHRKKGKTLFSQGDEGRSWYIIVKGSVNVDIQGQGVVCTLHEGDDFGNLAIINDAPRAATIVLAEDNCQLLRVDKHDFMRILKDVEANTVRLKEHDKDVLILQKIHTRSSSQDGRVDKPLPTSKTSQRHPPVAATPTRNHHRYAISAGTPAKIVEHVVKSLKPWSTARQSDEAMEDLILMYQVFMSTQELCKQLMKQYHSERADRIDASASIKRKVVYFVVRWSHIANHIFYDQPAVGPFLKELKQAVTDDTSSYPNLKEDLAKVYLPETSSSDSPSHKGWITVESPVVVRFPQPESKHFPHLPIKASDDVMLKVFNAQRTYATVRLPIISTVSEIISAVAEKQGRTSENLLLIHVKSDGDMYVLPKNMTSAATTVGVNSRFFICSPDEKDDIEPLEEQRVIPNNNSSVLELASSQEIAEHITQFDWELINSIHVMEFVHKVFGSHKFHSVTSNIDVFARRFNQLAYWAPTEICNCNNLNKRVHLLRKFIKIAQHLKELQNLNAFMAVMIGLGNQALSRLHSTWDKLPGKYKKLMTEFEAILDPSRNHRTYRLYVANLRAPLIPYLPLLMKDMTFQHEGNDSMRNGLVNFEKMHMMSNSIRDVIQACSKPLQLSHAVSAAKTFDECRQYSRNFGVITDQKLLNQLSAKAEAKR